MLFSSVTFLYYFLPAALLLYVFVQQRCKNFILLLVSLIFYGWGEPKYVLLMLVSIVQGYVFGLLIEGEEIVAAFRTIRDQLVFTNKRIISIDVQGLTGLKKSFAIMPYSRVQFFTIQTPGFAELVSDSELYLMFSNGFTAKFEFRGSVDIGALGRTISTYVL